MSPRIIYVEGVSEGVSNNLVSFEECMATDQCPSNDGLRLATKDSLDWWDTDDPNHERVTQAEFVGRFGVEPKLGMVFLMLDGEYFDYRGPFMAMSSELFIKVSHGQS